MTTSYHPNDDTLLRFSLGDLPTGPALIVATHMAACPHCRGAIATLDAVGGALLDQVDPVPMVGGEVLRVDPDAVLHGRLASTTASVPTVRRGIHAAQFPAAMSLPAPLRAHDISAWRPVAPGIVWARLTIAEDPQAKVLLLKARPGTMLPMHTHTGDEYTCILHGSFEDEGESIGVGGLVECSPTLTHQPRVDSDVDCICILSVDGRLVMSSWLARIAQVILGL